MQYTKEELNKDVNMTDTASHCNLLNEEGGVSHFNLRASFIHIWIHINFAEHFLQKQIPLPVTQCHQCHLNPQNIYALKKQFFVLFKCSIVITIMEVCGKKQHWACQRGKAIISATQSQGRGSSVPSACKHPQSPKHSSSTSTYCLSEPGW